MIHFFPVVFFRVCRFPSGSQTSKFPSALQRKTKQESPVCGATSVETFVANKPAGRKNRAMHRVRVGVLWGIFQTELNGIKRNWTELDGLGRNRTECCSCCKNRLLGSYQPYVSIPGSDRSTLFQKCSVPQCCGTRAFSIQ